MILELEDEQLATKDWELSKSRTHIMQPRTHSKKSAGDMGTQLRNSRFKHNFGTEGMSSSVPGFVSAITYNDISSEV